MAHQHTSDSGVRRWSPAILALAIAWSTLHAQDAAPPIPTPPFENTPVCPVARLIDACTVSVLADGKERGVRLCGVAVPKDKNIGERLERFLENLLKGEAVFVQYDPESTDDAEEPRPAWLFRSPDGLFVNLEVVRQGYAKVQAKPGCEHLELLRHYERRARQARKGIWAPRSREEPVRESRVASSQRAQDPGETVVYVTKSGKKYHRKDCYHLRKSSRPISLKEAIEKGYEPCSHCKPPTLKKP